MDEYLMIDDLVLRRQAMLRAWPFLHPGNNKRKLSRLTGIGLRSLDNLFAGISRDPKVSVCRRLAEATGTEVLWWVK